MSPIILEENPKIPRIERQHLVSRVVNFILTMYNTQLVKSIGELNKYEKAHRCLVNHLMLIGDGVRPTKEEFVEIMKEKSLYTVKDENVIEKHNYENIKRYIISTIGFSDGKDVASYLLKEIKAESGGRFYIPVKSV